MKERVTKEQVAYYNDLLELCIEVAGDLMGLEDVRINLRLSEGYDGYAIEWRVVDAKEPKKCYKSDYITVGGHQSKRAIFEQLNAAVKAFALVTNCLLAQDDARRTKSPAAFRRV